MIDPDGVAAPEQLARSVVLIMPRGGVREASLPGPIVLPRNSQGLYLVQRIRDEALRFAITYHRSVRGKRAMASVVDDVGLGGSRLTWC